MEAETLRKMLEKGQKFLVPGVYDALSARIAEESGFKAVFLTGYGVSAGLLGKADVGLITSVEMARTIAYIKESSGVFIIADADTGYGSPLNVGRTVQLYESAGVSAIQLEDQQWPKRCGHVEGKQIVSPEEMVAKILAAHEARRDNSTIIIARTDAISVEGFNSAVSRVQSYLAAGADMIFVEGPENTDQLVAIPSLIPAPHIINLAETGKGLQLSAEDVWKMGYSVALYPITAMLMAAKAMKKAYETLYSDHSSRYLHDEMISYKKFNTFIGMDKGISRDNQLLAEANKLLELKTGE